MLDDVHALDPRGGRREQLQRRITSALFPTCSPKAGRQSARLNRLHHKGIRLWEGPLTSILYRKTRQNDAVGHGSARTYRHLWSAYQRPGQCACNVLLTAWQKASQSARNLLADFCIE